MKIRVNVTAKDIRDGRKDFLDGSKCPIGRALNRKLPGVWVHFTGYYPPFPFQLPDKSIPVSAQEFQSRLAANPRARLKPFSFTLEV